MTPHLNLVLVRSALDALDIELTAWQQNKTEEARQRALKAARGMAQELQIIMNALRP